MKNRQSISYLLIRKEFRISSLKTLFQADLFHLILSIITCDEIKLKEMKFNNFLRLVATIIPSSHQKIEIQKLIFISTLKSQ